MIIVLQENEVIMDQGIKVYQSVLNQNFLKMVYQGDQREQGIIVYQAYQLNFR